MSSGRLLLAAWLLVSAPSPALADELFQQPEQISQLTVWLWPEYDRPSTLVILDLELPADVNLPATVEVPIPAEVGEPHAVAQRAADGQLVNAAYTRTANGEWAIISLETEVRRVWLEYYDQLTISGDQRSFTFVWAGPEPLSPIRYEVQRPVGAERVEISAEPTNARTGNDGLTYYQGVVEFDTDAGEARLHVEYLKSDPRLSAQAQPSVPETPSTAAPPPPDGFEWRGPLAYILGGLGLVLLVSGAYLFALGRWRARPSPSPPSHRSRSKAERYCHQCGGSVQAIDRFCRHCGAQLRPGD